MHFQNCAEFRGRIFGQGIVQFLQLCFDSISGQAKSGYFFADLMRVNEVMRHIHAA